MIYLDHNATTPIISTVRDKLIEVTDATPLNPSSAHRAGDDATRYLETARNQVAGLIGADPSRLSFNSGATEGNNVVLTEGARRGAIVTTTIEHSSVLVTAERLESEGTPVYRIEPDSEGFLAPDNVAHVLDEALANGPVGVVSIQWVNNETGVIQPLDEIVPLCHARGLWCHTDAAQVVGKMPVDVERTPVDFLTLTGHKLHAPTGVGVLYSRIPIQPWPLGGEQEQGRRAGTENLLGIAALGEAARHRREHFGDIEKRLAVMRDHFETVLIERFPWIKRNGAEPRVPNTSNLQFGNIDGEALLAQLDAADVAVSQSSACTSSRPTPSHVLLAMGRTEREAFSAVRVSFGETNTVDEVEDALERLSSILDRLAKLEALA